MIHANVLLLTSWSRLSQKHLPIRDTFVLGACFLKAGHLERRRLNSMEREHKTRSAEVKDYVRGTFEHDETLL